MKKVLLSVISLFSINLQAQITLNASGYPGSVLGTDTLMTTKSTSTFPVLTAATSATWDMSTVTDSPVLIYDRRVAATGYGYADSNVFSFAGYAYQGNVLYDITPIALFEYGIKIQRSAYHLPNPPFALAADSMVFDLQTLLYSAPRTQIAFPATYNTNWQSTYNYDFTFHITAIEIGYLTSTPGIVRSFVTEKDTVVGWGTMRVKNADGTPSAYVSVLQVQSTIIRTDSFFIGGVIPSTAVLATLGVTEGQKDTSYEQNYYRTGEVQPVAVVDFNDPGYTQPYTATTHVHGPAPFLAVPNQESKPKVKVYPNPVTGNTIDLELPSVGGAWVYELIDVNGRTVKGDVLKPNGTQAQITLPASLPAGVYYLKVNNDSNPVSVMQIDVVR